MSFRKIVRRILQRCNAKVDNFCGIQDLMYTINDKIFISYIMFTVVSIHIVLLHCCPDTHNYLYVSLNYIDILVCLRLQPDITSNLYTL